MTEENPSASSKESQSESTSKGTFAKEHRSQDSSVRGSIGSVSQAASKLSLLSVSTSEALPWSGSTSFEDPGPPPHKPLKALIFQIGLPITTLSLSHSSAVTVSTEYLGKPPPESLETETETRLERALKEGLKSKQHAIRATRGAGIGHVSIQKPVTQPATIPSGMAARETRKELDQTQGEFFCVTQLTKEAKPPPPDVSCIS